MPSAKCLAICSGFILKPKQNNGLYFANNIFKCILMNENLGILLRVSLMYMPKDLTANKSALGQKMTWRQTCDKPLYEQVMAQFTDAYMYHTASVC